MKVVSVKNREIPALVRGLSTLLAMDLPPNLAFRVGRVATQIEAGVEAYNQARNGLLARHAKKKNGKLFEENGKIELETPIEYRDEEYALNQEDAEDVRPLQYPDLERYWNETGKLVKPAMLADILPVLMHLPDTTGDVVVLRYGDLNGVSLGVSELGEIDLPPGLAIVIAQAASSIASLATKYSRRSDELLAKHAKRNKDGKVAVQAGAVQFKTPADFAADDAALRAEEAGEVQRISTKAMLEVLDAHGIAVKPRVLVTLAPILSDDFDNDSGVD